MSVIVHLREMGQETTHFHGKGEKISKKNGFEIRFRDETYQYCWKVYPQGLQIRSSSEIDVFLTLRADHQTRGHIDSEYGRIDLVCETHLYEMRDSEIEVRYDLIQGEQRQPFHFVLTIKEDPSHVH